MAGTGMRASRERMPDRAACRFNGSKSKKKVKKNGRELVPIGKILVPDLLKPGM